MSFFENLKRSFGFGTDIDNDDLLSDSPGIPEVEPSETAATAPTNSSANDGLMAVLDGVIDVFNQTQPEFVRQSLSSESQRRYVYERMDASLRAYLENLANETRRECISKMAGENASRTAETEKLRQSSEQLTQQRDELRQQLVSAERQKRALADRVHDLETRAADLEAEREQADLVNRGLLNKLKVMGLQAGINPEELPDVPDNSEIKEQLQTLTAEIEAKDAKIKELSDDLALLSDKSRMAEQMADDLRRRASESRQALEAKEAELAEAKRAIDSMAELKQRVDSFDEVLRKRDERIKELRLQIAEMEKEHSPKGATIDFSAPAAMDTEVAYAAQPKEKAPKRQRKAIASDAPTISDRDLAEIDRSFGYHPPKRTHVPDNDAQMSLNFDE